jgi:hypothetical protein
MTFTRGALYLTGILGLTLLFGSGHAVAESASCQAQLKEQDARCQELAEKLADACPSGTDIKETALCRELSNQIANTCTRRPCGPPPRKAKRKAKKGGMGMSKSKKASPTKQ